MLALISHGMLALISHEVLRIFLFINSPPMQVFYAACQGLLYVLCYRLEQLVTGKAGDSLADSVRRLFKDAIPVLLQSR